MLVPLALRRPGMSVLGEVMLGLPAATETPGLRSRPSCPWGPGWDTVPNLKAGDMCMERVQTTLMDWQPLAIIQHVHT